MAISGGQHESSRAVLREKRGGEQYYSRHSKIGNGTSDMAKNKTSNIQIGNETLSMKTGNETLNTKTGNETLNMKTDQD